jgi:hypothetical protein
VWAAWALTSWIACRSDQVREVFATYPFKFRDDAVSIMDGDDEGKRSGQFFFFFPFIFTF